MPKLEDHVLVGFDYKDLINIHSYFAQQQQKSDTSRQIMSRCEDIFLGLLQETYPTDITSGNYLHNRD